MPVLKIIGERLLPLDSSRHPDDPSPEETARREMDHAPDLLYDGEDTVYRYEILDDDADADSAPLDPPAEEDPGALLAQIQTLVERLRARVDAGTGAD